jgi:NADH:ubiquinone oxidoreductase subunit 6 (subunit J)
MVIFNKDSLRFGLLLGLLGPVVGLFGFYFWKFRLYRFEEFLRALQQNKPLVTAITIPCLLVNIILFTFYINTRRDQTAKGIFAVTIIYAVASLLFKMWG